MLNLLHCRGLAKKSANILLFRQCLMLIFICFTLSATQKNLIPMCLDLLNYVIFLLLAIFSAVSLSCHKRFDFIVYPFVSKNYSHQLLYGRYSLFSIPSYYVEPLGFIFCLLELCVNPYTKGTEPFCVSFHVHMNRMG